MGGDFPMSIPHTVTIVPERSFLHAAPLLARLPVQVMAHICKRNPTMNLITQYGVHVRSLCIAAHCTVRLLGGNTMLCIFVLSFIFVGMVTQLQRTVANKFVKATGQLQSLVANQKYIRDKCATA